MVRRLLGQAVVLAAAFATLALLVPETAKAQKKYELVVTGPTVNIRAQPDSNARVVGKATRGDRFPALGPSKDKRWIRVRYKGREAWITAAPKLVNVREATGEVEPPPPPENGGSPSWTTVVRDTEIRLGPGGGAPVVADVLRGDQLKFGGFSKDKRFVRVQTDDGSSGWIARSDVVPGKRDDIGPAKKPKRVKKDKPPRNPFAGNRNRRENRVVRVTPVFAVVQQKVATEFSSFAYTTTAFAPGAQVWVDWNLRDNFVGGRLDFTGGYLFALTGGVPAPPQLLPPGEEIVLNASVHRVDLATTYRRDLGFMDLIVLGGYRFHLYYIQPQTLSYYFSNNYHTLNLQVGGMVPLMDDRLFIDFRGGVMPGILIETYGNGQAGSSGSVPIALGYEGHLGARYTELPAGLQAGLDLGFTLYQTRFQGTGQRAGSVFDNAFVQDVVITAGLVVRRSF